MPNFEYQYALAVLDNIRAVIVAGMNTELGLIDATLPTIERYTTPIDALVNFPAVYVEWVNSDIDKSEDSGFCRQVHEFSIGVSVIDTDHDVLTKRVLQYLAAATRTLDKMTPDALMTGITSVIGAPVWSTVRHDGTRGLRFNEGAGIYRRDAYLTLMVEFYESKG
jgi:hypothetical protein